MGKGGIPDRWLDYSSMGELIQGTRFIACKVPLKEALLRNLPENQRYGPEDLMKAVPNIGVLVDLTNTSRYYSSIDFQRNNIQYEKVSCPGHEVPPRPVVNRFFNIVNKFLDEHKDDDSVIVVHCTHGVNRTGYLICRYMIQNMEMNPDVALQKFRDARGHKIERLNYVKDLIATRKANDSQLPNPVGNRRSRRERRSSRDDQGLQYNWRARQLNFDVDTAEARGPSSCNWSSSDHFSQARQVTYPEDRKPASWSGNADVMYRRQNPVPQPSYSGLPHGSRGGNWSGDVSLAPPQRHLYPSTPRTVPYHRPAFDFASRVNRSVPRNPRDLGQRLNRPLFRHNQVNAAMQPDVGPSTR